MSVTTKPEHPYADQNEQEQKTFDQLSGGADTAWDAAIEQRDAGLFRYVPLEQLTPFETGAETPTADRDHVSAELGKRAVEEAPDAEADPMQTAPIIETPVSPELRQYATVEEFLEDMNNFDMFFRGGLGEYYRERACYERFEDQYPELADALHKVFSTYQDDAREIPFDSEQAHLLFRGYQAMVELVDRDDPGVCDDGAVDPYFLNR